MRETEILSIRLSPDGLSFWTGDRMSLSPTDIRITPAGRIKARNISFDQLRSGRQGRKLGKLCTKYGRVVVCLDTLRSVPIPAELFQAGSEHGYLEINNYHAGTEDETIVSPPFHGTVSVTLFSRESLELVRSVAGRETIFASCQQYCIARNSRYVPSRQPGQLVTTIFLTHKNIYIAVRELSGKLIYTESLPFSSANDILFYLSRLEDTIGPVKSNPLFLHGEDIGKTGKILRKFIKHCRCV